MRISLLLYDLQMLPSSHHTDTKCCQQYTIQTNHTNVQISQMSFSYSSSSSLECTHDDENYSIANLSFNDDTDFICISMRTNNDNNNNTNNQDGLVWTRDILFRIHKSIMTMILVQLLLPCLFAANVHCNNHQYHFQHYQNNTILWLVVNCEDTHEEETIGTNKVDWNGALFVSTSTTT